MQWDESEHPRDHAGRFAERPDWANRVSDAIGNRPPSYDYTPGIDLSDQWEQIAGDASDYDIAHPRDGWYGSVALTEVVKKQPWHGNHAKMGAPQELDEAVASGGVELFRGTRGEMPTSRPSGEPGSFDFKRSPMYHAQQMAAGQGLLGTGIYGDGWYTSVDRRAAEKYGMTMSLPHGPAEPDPRTITRMVLSPDARVVQWDSPEIEDMTTKLAGSDRTALVADRGVAAVLLGYDAMSIPGQNDGSGYDADQFVVFNHTALMFEHPYDESLLPPGVARYGQDAPSPRAAANWDMVRADSADDSIDYPDVDSRQIVNGVDGKLAEIWRIQGFDGPPRVVTDGQMESEIQNGAIPIYRGLLPNGGATAGEIAASYIDGEHRPAPGIFGSGSYFSPDKETAGTYAGLYTHSGGWVEGPGVVMRVAISPDARVVDLHDLLEMHQKDQLSSTWEGDLRRRRARQSVTSDMGRYASILGYDAVRVGLGNPPGRFGHEYIVLNRTATIATRPDQP